MIVAELVRAGVCADHVVKRHDVQFESRSSYILSQLIMHMHVVFKLHQITGFYQFEVKSHVLQHGKTPWGIIYHFRSTAQFTLSCWKIKWFYNSSCLLGSGRPLSLWRSTPSFFRHFSHVDQKSFSMPESI